MGLSAGKLVILGKWLFTRQPTSAAIDITHRCNLKCLHCYWWKQEHPRELSDSEMLACMERLRATGLRAAILYGGEPTLRLELCRAACRIFDATLAFTNGTNGFPALEKGQWILSLDGPEDVNDRLRGKGVYSLALENLLQAPRPPIVHITICRANQDRIEDFIKEMMGLPIKGIGFSFYTPQRGSDDKEFFIPLEERDRVVRHLLGLRRIYGEKVGFTPAMARQFLTYGDFRKWNSFSACPVSKRVRCFTSDGKLKDCTYGSNADCSRCGCTAVAAYRAAFRPLDYKTLRLIMGLMVPEYRAPDVNA
ncbi:MAG: radical SAM protein [Pseudomonadota bacterium]